MKPRWKYSREARKARYCADCKRRLKKDESTLCTMCFAELLTVTVEEELIETREEDEDD